MELTTHYTQRNGRQAVVNRIERSRHLVVGVDLAQSMDRTAIALIEHLVIPTGEFRVDDSGHCDVADEYWREEFIVRELDRLERGLPYGAIVAEIEHRMQLVDKDADLVIDDTGVGRPVGDLFEAQTNLRPIRVTATSGNDVYRDNETTYTVPKKTLIASLDGILHNAPSVLGGANQKHARAVIMFRHGLSTEQVVRDELASMRRKLSQSGRATFDAASGKHDDTISAVCLACWWASYQHSPAGEGRRRGEFSVGAVQCW